jgi:beta-mannosidase
VFEHWRGDFPYKGGHTVWTWNLCEPANSWNVVDWFGQPLIAYYAVKRANEPIHVMANTNWFSWGPGDMFHAEVQAISDAPGPLAGVRMSAQVLDAEMRKVAARTWKIDVPGGEIATASRNIEWPIPSDASEGYFFLLVTLEDGAGKRLSQQAYAMRILKSLADPEARRLWQAKPSFDPICSSGPWLKQQMAATPTKIEAKLVRASSEGSDGMVTVLVTNSGKLPAYPVVLRTTPDTYSTIWDDDYFWLAPGESREIRGRVRLDMAGLDQVTYPKKARLSDIRILVGAWNAADVVARPPSRRA